MNVYNTMQINSNLLISKGKKPRKGQVFLCTLCKKEVYKPQSRIKAYKTTFCCKEHNILWMKQNAFSFECSVCKKTKYTQPFQMKIRAVPTCSIKCRAVLTRQKAIERRRNGYTKHQLDRLQRYSPEAETWRKSVFERDNYTCQMCNTKGGYLEADHIKPWAYFEELRFELSNGRTLCRPCHDTTKISAKAMKELYCGKHESQPTPDAKIR